MPPALIQFAHRLEASARWPLPRKEFPRVSTKHAFSSKFPQHFVSTRLGAWATVHGRLKSGPCQECGLCARLQGQLLELRDAASDHGADRHGKCVSTKQFSKSICEKSFPFYYKPILDNSPIRVCGRCI